MNNEFLQTEEAIVAMLKTVYDPEIPVNVFDLGLIYKVDVDDEKNVRIDMTLTAPNCPAADFISSILKRRSRIPPFTTSFSLVRMKVFPFPGFT